MNTKKVSFWSEGTIFVAWGVVFRCLWGSVLGPGGSFLGAMGSWSAFLDICQSKNRKRRCLAPLFSGFWPYFWSIFEGFFDEFVVHFSKVDFLLKKRVFSWKAVSLR